MCDNYQTGSPQTDFGNQAGNCDPGIEIRRGFWLVTVGTGIREFEVFFLEDGNRKVFSHNPVRAVLEPFKDIVNPLPPLNEQPDQQ